MNKYMKVIESVLPLLDTIGEGIQHTQSQLSELRYEESLTMLKDIMEGVASIESALEPIIPRLVENSIVSLTATLRANISNTVGSYMQGKELNLKKQVEEDIVLAFKNWREEIERVLKPYTVS